MTLGFGRSAKTAKSMDEIQGSFATLKDDDVKQQLQVLRLRCARSAVSTFAQDDNGFGGLERKATATANTGILRFARG